LFYSGRLNNLLENKTLNVTFDKKTSVKMRIEDSFEDHVCICPDVIENLIKYRSLSCYLDIFKTLNCTDLSCTRHSSHLFSLEETKQEVWFKDIENFKDFYSTKFFGKYGTSGVNDLSSAEASGIATINTLNILFYIIMKNKFNLILFEEPEINLYPEVEKFLPFLLDFWPGVAKKEDRN